MIISDSTALITLINIDEFGLLELFADRIIIPAQVYDEIARRPSAKRFIDGFIDKGFIEIRQCTNETLINEINYILDIGESASIALAIEHGLPLIIDEKKGRTFARRQGVEIIGLIGVLRFLYIEERISKTKTKEIIQKLNDSEFRIDKRLLEMILQ